MLGAVIRNGNNTLVIDLPTGMMDLQTKLSSIGIQETSDKIKLSDEDDDQIRVKLYATEPEEVHLLSLLAPNRTLADANSSMEMLQRANREFLPRLKCSLLGNGYRTLDDFFNDAKRLFTKQSPEDITMDKNKPTKFREKLLKIRAPKKTAAKAAVFATFAAFLLGIAMGLFAKWLDNLALDDTVW